MTDPAADPSGVELFAGLSRADVARLVERVVRHRLGRALSAVEEQPRSASVDAVHEPTDLTTAVDREIRGCDHLGR